MKTECGKVIIAGATRSYNPAKMRKTASAWRDEKRKPITIKASPLIKEHPGHVEVVPHPYYFELKVNGERAGVWEIKIENEVPPFWNEMGEIYFLHGNEFSVKKSFRRSNMPNNWYAAAFRAAVQQFYLAQVFPGWLLDSNVTNPAMKAVFATAHEVARMVEYKENKWQMHAFMDKTP
jgi:hypothetical protein